MFNKNLAKASTSTT